MKRLVLVAVLVSVWEPCSGVWWWVYGLLCGAVSNRSVLHAGPVLSAPFFVRSTGLSVLGRLYRLIAPERRWCVWRRRSWTRNSATSAGNIPTWCPAWPEARETPLPSARFNFGTADGTALRWRTLAPSSSRCLSAVSFILVVVEMPDMLLTQFWRVWCPQRYALFVTTAKRKTPARRLCWRYLLRSALVPEPNNIIAPAISFLWNIGQDDTWQDPRKTRWNTLPSL